MLDEYVVPAACVVAHFGCVSVLCVFAYRLGRVRGLHEAVEATAAEESLKAAVATLRRLAAEAEE